MPRALILVALSIAACGQESPAPTAYPALPGAPFGVPGLTALPLPTAAPVPPVTGACVVGRWRANDFLQMVRRSMGRQLPGGANVTRASGTIDLEFRAPDSTGGGQLVVTAAELVHRAVIREQGITATATHTLTGAATIPYRPLGPDTVEVSDTAENQLRARVSVRTSIGIGGAQGGGERLDLSGTYVHECTPTQVRFWERAPDGQRRGDPLVLDRLP